MARSRLQRCPYIQMQMHQRLAIAQKNIWASLINSQISDCDFCCHVTSIWHLFLISAILFRLFCQLNLQFDSVFFFSRSDVASAISAEIKQVIYWSLGKCESLHWYGFMYIQRLYVDDEITLRKSFFESTQQ